MGTVQNHFLKIMAAYGKSESPKVLLDGRSQGKYNLSMADFVNLMIDLDKISYSMIEK